jgi:peroxiredoxin
MKSSICLIFGLFLATNSWAAPEIGKAAPDFTLADAHGKLHTLSDYRGKLVVLEWTNPDCPYVQRHYKEGTMTALESAYSDTQVVWIAVNTTHYNTAAATRKWSIEKGLTYPTLIDSNGAIGHLYAAKTTPHMFVIDALGKLIYDGAIDDAPRGEKKRSERVIYVEQVIEAALQNKAPSSSRTKPYGCSVKYAGK